VNEPRRTLVTGASSGIGEAVARLCAERGDRVALLARRPAELERVAASLPGRERHVLLPCDVGDESALRASFGVVRERFGALDLLVNNAGIGYRAPVGELEPDPLRRLFATNVEGLLLCCKHALPLLRAGTRPVVVNLSSVVGRRGFPGQAAYSASKAAVCSIGEALRLEWAEFGIAVCTLDPTTTRTNFFAAQTDPHALPPPNLERAMDPRVVARAVLELDRRPEPEVFLAPRWKWMGVLSLLAPRRADRLLERRLSRKKPR
jgi:NAD(P)-dependent dehydrogenase (short-subunit alcohol dehydrogenase family)